MNRLCLGIAASCAISVSSIASAQTACDADADHDGIVTGADLSIVLNDWGACRGCPGDITGNGAVDGVDLAAVLAEWGGECRPAVDSTSPSTGYVGGGTVVTIHGSNLAWITSVTFGGIEGTGIRRVDSETIEVVTPAGSEGSVEVVVTATNGSVTLPGGFVYFKTSVPTWATALNYLPDPAVVYDANLHAAVVATGWAWKVRDNGTGIEMLLIPPGTYDMGCSASNLYGCSSSENPVHPVTITQPFYMSRTEVTQAQWTAVMGSNPSSFRFASAQVPASEVPNRPVESVSWNTIQGFLSATGMRLPTEAEWEYAYRAGTTTAFHGWAGQPAGTNDDSQLVNISWFPTAYGGDALSQTRPVGGKAANGFGLHDMAGNVWEWVSDWYGERYYASSPSEDPQGPVSGASRVFRGGSWNLESQAHRASNRQFWTPVGDSFVNGFRVARNP